jgi:hypothetical protein
VHLREKLQVIIIDQHNNNSGYRSIDGVSTVGEFVVDLIDSRGTDYSINTTTAVDRSVDGVSTVKEFIDLDDKGRKKINRETDSRYVD